MIDDHLFRSGSQRFSFVAEKDVKADDIRKLRITQCSDHFELFHQLASTEVSRIGVDRQNLSGIGKIAPLDGNGVGKRGVWFGIMRQIAGRNQDVYSERQRTD